MKHDLIPVVISIGIACSSSPAISNPPNPTEIHAPKSNQNNSEKCKIKLTAPDFRNIYNNPLTFDCTETEIIKGVNYGIAQMDFQYDPNRRRVSDNIKFYIANVSLSETRVSLSTYFFDVEDGKTIDEFSGETIHHKDLTYCGLRVISTVRPIQGTNWKGWLTEDSYIGKARRNCVSPKEYSSRFRCIGLMIGNEKISAVMNKVCLLRKHQTNIQDGLSYDAFMGMVRTIRLNTNNSSDN